MQQRTLVESHRDQISVRIMGLAQHWFPADRLNKLYKVVICVRVICRAGGGSQAIKPHLTNSRPSRVAI
jgi:hypothetical protein